MTRAIAAAFAAALAAAAGCTSFETMQTCRFVDEDGRFLVVEYGRGSDEHVTRFKSPANGRTLEMRSRLRVRVKMPDGKSFMAFQCMNFSNNGTMYVSDDEEWKYLASGVTCHVGRRDRERDDYLVVYSGSICQSPVRYDKR